MVAMQQMSGTDAAEVFYDVAMRRLDEQFERFNGLDTKAATVFGLSNAIIALFGSMLSMSKLPSGLGEGAFGVFLVVGVLFYLYVLYASYQAYQIRDISLRPDMETLREVSITGTISEVRRGVAEQCMLSIKENEELLDKKADCVLSAILFLPFESLLLAAASLIALASK